MPALSLVLSWVIRLSLVRLSSAPMYITVRSKLCMAIFGKRNKSLPYRLLCCSCVVLRCEALQKTCDCYTAYLMVCLSLTLVQSRNIGPMSSPSHPNSFLLCRGSEQHGVFSKDTVANTLPSAFAGDVLQLGMGGKGPTCICWPANISINGLAAPV